MTFTRRNILQAGLLALVMGVLSGCQQQPVKSDEGQTGRMGDVSEEAQLSEAAAVYTELAAEYLRQGNREVALRNARKAVIVAPKDPSAHNMLALVHQQLGENPLAEKHFAEAVRLDPKDPFANNAYGSFLCNLKRYDEADLRFQAAVANPLNPSPWVPLTNAGVCAHEQNELEKAENYLRGALRANPRVAPALMKMADISFRHGRYLSARAYLQRYLEVAQHTAETLWLGIQTERELGDKDQVASYTLLLRARFPDSEQTRRLKE